MNAKTLTCLLILVAIAAPVKRWPSKGVLRLFDFDWETS